MHDGSRGDVAMIREIGIEFGARDEQPAERRVTFRDPEKRSWEGIPEHLRVLALLVVEDLPYKFLVSANEADAVPRSRVIEAEELCGFDGPQSPTLTLLLEHPLPIMVQYLSGGWWLVARIHAGWHPDDTRSR
jgi:hypothetical protein